VQIDGLFGPRGILPAADFLSAVAQRFGAERFLLLPSVFWLGASRGALETAALAGVLLAALLVAGLAPRAILVALWALYLSFLSVGQVFLGYQWDSLLVEAGFLAIWLAPGGWRPPPGRPSEPAPVAVFLLRLLLFRLMLGSGLVKLLSGDPSWWGLTALRVHYETQPLPTWIGWWAHQLPPAFQTLSCAVALAIELVVPFLIFAPRRLRVLAFVPLAGLQVLIALTGNYAFFNLLTLALCLLLLDDRALPEFVRRRLGREDPAPRAWPAGWLGPVAAVAVLAGLVQILSTAGLRIPWPAPVTAVVRVGERFGLGSPYGLFAVMTTSRHEILVEGSRDGVDWRTYAFRWKPGDLRGRPRFVAPHQPRLDWQMWFAALSSCADNPWFVRFLDALLQGRPEVLGLLGTNPFPHAPPRFVRAEIYDYRFTDVATLFRDGAWWRRERLGLYCPVLTREDDRLVVAPGDPKTPPVLGDGGARGKIRRPRRTP
jgi:lipase maturation factor 1